MFARGWMRLAIVTAMTTAVWSPPLRAQHSHAARAASDPANERVWIVRPGDTISSIADQLGVSVPVLAARNYLTRPYTLRLGRRLRLPAGVSSDVVRRLPTRGASSSPSAAGSSNPAGGTGGTGSRGGGAIDNDEATEQRPGFGTLYRARDRALLETNLRADNQSLRVRIERFLRFRDGSRHVIHPRLVHALASISDHFSHRRVVVLSGFRPILRNRSAPRSRHSQGFAVDARVEGVSLAALFDYCMSLENMGCGLYPRARYVHIDVRRESLDWTATRRPQGDDGRDPDVNERVEDVQADAAPTREAASE